MNDLNYALIGKRIRKIRLAKGMTQEYLAEAADINASHICNIENRGAKMSLPTLNKICHALGVTIDYIISDSESAREGAYERTLILEVQKLDPNMKDRLLKIVQALE